MRRAVIIVETERRSSPRAHDDVGSRATVRIASVATSTVAGCVAGRVPSMNERKSCVGGSGEAPPPCAPANSPGPAP